MIAVISAETSASPTFGSLEIEGATYVKRLEIRKPGKSDMIVRPASGDGNGNFVLVVTVEGPIIGGGQLLHHIHRMFKRSVSFSAAISMS